MLDKPARASRSACAGSSRTARTWRSTSRYFESPRRPGHGHRLLAIPSRERLERVLQLRARRERVPLAVRHPLAVALPPGAAVRAARRRRGAPRRLRARRVRRPGSSAATPTGAGRSGSRSTTCWSRRWSATTTSTATRLKVECPTGSGRMHEPRARSRASWRAASPTSSSPTRAAGGPATATTRASATTRTGATWSSSTSTSTATPAAASARATRPAGPPWPSAASNTWHDGKRRTRRRSRHERTPIHRRFPGSARQGDAMKAVAIFPGAARSEADRRRRAAPRRTERRPAPHARRRHLRHRQGALRLRVRYAARRERPPRDRPRVARRGGRGRLGA